MDRDKLASAAYAALSPAGRKVLAAIEREVKRVGGVVVIGFADFARRCDVSHSAAYSGLKQVVLLGFASVETGPRPRRIHTIRLRELAGHRRGRGQAAALAGTFAGSSNR